MTESSNPLLNQLGLPAFDRIEPKHVQPAVAAMLDEAQQTLAHLESTLTPTWDGLLQPLEELNRRVMATWGPISHLVGVKNSAELREAYNTVLPQVVTFSLKFSQSQPIYQALKALKQGSEWSQLSATRQRIIDKKIQEAEFSGIGLEGAQRERFNEISHRLSTLGTEFSDHVLDAVKHYELKVTDPAAMQGVPENFRSMWAHTYQQKHPDEPESSADQGPWSISLDHASLEPFLKYCPDRVLREQLYRAHVTKAAQDPYDNTSKINEILQLRREMAKLLGFSTYAEMSLAQKMAGSVDDVTHLLQDLRDAAKPHAEQELADLQEFAQEKGLEGDLKNWDFSFYSERLRHKLFDFSEEAIRPYFPLQKVLEGLFKLVNRIFDIEVRPTKKNVATWHPNVTFYDIFDANDQKIAGFYLDPYSRPAEKRGGAWMDTCIDRGYYQGDLYLPVAYLVCNGTPPTKNAPSTLSFREVETLFHEFGHGLQHMLTQVNEASAAGINGIEWDAVELPSQFMENWCYHKPTLLSLTSHVETGEPLPDSIFAKIEKARTFQAASAMARQLHFGMIDMELHTRFDASGNQDVFALNRQIARQVVALQPLPEDRFLCSFLHIFAGGYAAGYYSYKWAEVLSADAFSRFEEAGLDDETNVQKIGHEFRDTILARGGSQHPMEVFKDFRGREPDVKPLLRHSGIS
jgi:oligopeptidase A